MPKRNFDNFMAEEGSDSRIPNSLFVSFSKRRDGLFSKAAKLCDLFDGTQVAVLILSPSGNPYAFGHSSVDNVLHRYYLRQPTIQNTTYPLMITTTANTSDKHRYQAKQVETLKARVKQAQNRRVLNSASLGDLKARIDKACELCKTVEELEFLRDKFLALLESVRKRIILGGSSFSYSSYGEGKVVETDTTMVGPAEDYVLSCTDTGMADHVFCDISSLDAMGSQNDMSYLLEMPGQSPQEGKLVVDETDYVFDDVFDNKNLFAIGFDHDDNLAVGMTGDSLYPHLGGEVSLAANVFCNVSPLAVMDTPNDLSCNPMEMFGSCYGEMVGVSDIDQVFQLS